MIRSRLWVVLIIAVAACAEGARAGVGDDPAKGTNTWPTTDTSFSHVGYGGPDGTTYTAPSDRCKTASDFPDLLANGSFEAEDTDDRIQWWSDLYGKRVGVADTNVKKHGERSLRVSKPGGLRSILVPYTGGRVRVTGWIRTDDVVHGEQSYHKAALQLISFDENKQPIGHADIALVDGSSDWTRHEGVYVLSRKVAYVAVYCHIWGPRTQGTVWFDDVTLVSLDSNLASRPLDLTRAKVRVNFDEPLQPFRHLWVGSDVGSMDRVVSDTQTSAMAHASRFGFRYIRMHDCVHNPRIYTEDDSGNPVYDWTRFDERIQMVLDHGMSPIIVLETMPPEIATRDGGLGWTNPYPPAGVEGYRKWQQLVYQIVAHCKGRWSDNIHNWYFEVWNEPSARRYFRGTQEEYFKIYDHSVAGATAADPNIRIGGPGGAGTSWLRPFLMHCRSGHNDATGGIGTRIDFLSWHIYTAGNGIPSFDKLRTNLREVRDEALNCFSEYTGLPTLITEWGSRSTRFHTHDQTYDAAFRTMAVRAFLDHDITFALPFSLGSGPPHAHEGFQGDLALFTKTTIPKPSFRAFELLHRMGGMRVALDSTNDPVGGLAAISADQSHAWVTLYNLVEDPDHAPYQTRVTIVLDGLSSSQWRALSTMIAPGGTDPYPVWKAMGSPEKLTDDQRAELLRASALQDPVPVPIRDGEIQLEMPAFSVIQIALTRDDTD